jgi:hypothetical protein
MGHVSDNGINGNIPIPDCFVHQFSGDSTVDAATDSTNDPSLWPANLPNASNLLANEFFLDLTVGNMHYGKNRRNY